MSAPRTPWPGLALIGWLACDGGAAKPVVPPPSQSPVAPAAPAPPPTPAKPAPAAPRDARTNGLPDCRFEQPEGWTGGQVSWLGACREGFANGNGVLLDAVTGQERERFYGLLEQGHLKVGVLQSGGGYQAGNWENGALAATLPDDVAQRNVTIAAFRAATAAAEGAGKSLAKKDPKSSRFYAKQARQLRDQMD